MRIFIQGIPARKLKEYEKKMVTEKPGDKPNSTRKIITGVHSKEL